jgi:hypothetical protein
MGPLAAAALAGGGGFLAGSLLGGKKSKKIKIPSLSGEASEFAGEISDILTSGLLGAGYFPDIEAQNMQEILDSLKETYGEQSAELASLSKRFIPKSDVEMQDYLGKELKGSYQRQKHDIISQAKLAPELEKETAINESLGYLGGAEAFSSQLSSLYANTALNQMYSPTFQSQLAGGAGGALGHVVSMNPNMGNSIPNPLNILGQIPDFFKQWTKTKGGIS